MVDYLIEVDIEKNRSYESEAQETEVVAYSVSSTKEDDDVEELQYSKVRKKEANPHLTTKRMRVAIIAILLFVLLALSISIPVSRKRRNKRNDTPIEASSSSPAKNCIDTNDNIFRSKLPTYLHISIGGINNELTPTQDEYIEDSLKTTYNALAGCNDVFTRHMESVTFINQTRTESEDGSGTIVKAMFRSTVSYACDEDICPDPEEPAFSSGPPLGSTTPGRKKIRDRTRGRKRNLAITLNRRTKDKKTKKAISALDYFAKIDASLQKMPKGAKDQTPYLLDAATGAEVQKTQYKSTAKKGAMDTIANDSPSIIVADNDAPLDTIGTTTYTTESLDKKSKKTKDKKDKVSSQHDSTEGWKDDSNSGGGSSGSTGTLLDEGWQDGSNSGGSSSGSTGTLFDPINSNINNEGQALADDIRIDSGTTQSVGEGKKSKGKKEGGKKKGKKSGA